MVRYFLFSIFLVLSSSVSFADWSDEVYDHSEYFPDLPSGMFSTTLIGTCMEPYKDFSEMKGKVRRVKVKNKLVKKGYMKVRLATQRKNTRKSPFIFFIPGAFNNLDDSQSRFMMHEFLKKGYNVVTVPNPWGTDFIKLGTKRPVGSFVYEGKVLYETFKNMFGYLKYKNYDISEIKIVGVSYGSFLGAMISAFNGESKNPLNITETTILSPPFHLGETIARLDHYINKSKKHISENLISYFFRFKRFCRSNDSLSLTKKVSERKAMSLVIGAGFHRSLVKSTVTYDRVSRLNKVPRRFLGNFSRKYRKWRKKWNFQKYFETYAPESRELMLSEKGDINYWINSATSSQDISFRVLTSNNDFLNEPVSSFFPYRNTIALDSGGHYGYRGMSWYRDFLDIAF